MKRDRLHALRSIPLDDVLTHLGATRDRDDRHKWRLGRHRLNVTGAQFYDHREGRGGGGAIDCVMHLLELTFTDAVAYLDRHWGTVPAVAPDARRTTRMARQRSAAAQTPPRSFVPPPPDARAWHADVRPYLTVRRCLPTALVDMLHAQGSVYADGRGNAVFVRRDEAGRITGTSLRGTRPGSHFKGLAAGSRRAEGWFSIEGDGHADGVGSPCLVLVESAIDALSYVALHPGLHGTVIATDGSGALPDRQIMAALVSGHDVRCGFDRDEAGEARWRTLQALYGDDHQLRRQRPRAKDWNEDLQASRDSGN